MSFSRESDPDGLERAAWNGPSDDACGVVLPVGRILAQTPNAALALRDVAVYRDGCLFTVHAVARRMGMPKRAWSKLEDQITSGPESGEYSDEGPDLMRFTVEYASGAHSSTFDEQHWDDDEPPAAPYLRLWKSDYGNTTDSDEYEAADYRIWLWPLPPPEDFAFGLEWPGSGVEALSFGMDGAGLVKAADRVQVYWP